MGLFKDTNVSENALFRVFSYGAGIENYKFGTFGRIRYGVTHFFKKSFKLFAVGKVLLTTICMDVSAVFAFPF